MPLTDLVRYLNSRDRDQRPFLRLDDPFEAVPSGAIAHYARITLDSVYAPIYVGASGSLYGHAAALKAQGELNDLPLNPEAVFAIPSSDEEFVHLDRLVRTLHALNYLLHPEQQNLHVRTHLRHIETVPSGHGIVFENALRACGLSPRDITLEVQIDTAPDQAVRQALESYRARGYRLALSVVAHSWQESHWLLALNPDVVRLDSDLLRKPEQLNLFALRLADHDIRSLVSVNGERETNIARKAGIGLLQAMVPSSVEQTSPHFNRAREKDRPRAA